MLARFIDEKDATDVTELVIGKVYSVDLNDGEWVDVYDEQNNRIGTYCIGRFEFF